MNTTPPDPGRLSNELDVRYYADMLWRSRLLLATAALGGLGMGILIGEIQTPRYRARAQLQVSPPTPTNMTVTDALVGTGNPLRDRQFFNTQFSVLRSRVLGERVVKRLKLAERPPFQGHPDPPGLLMSHVSIEPVPDTFVIEVHVNHEDPKEAALWANTLADIYVEYSIEGQVEAAKRAYEWVHERLADTQTNMQEAQDKLLKSYQGQEFFVPEGSVSGVATSLTKLQEDHVDTQAKKIALEAALQEFEELRRRGRSLDTVPQAATDSIILDLNGRVETLKLELSKLKEKFKEAHPEVQRIQVQIDQINKARTARTLKIEEGLRAEHRQLQRREAELREAMDAQKTQAVAQSRKLGELESLKKQADSANNLYTVLLQKLNETNIAASIQSNNVRLLDRATLPRQPVWPDKKKIAGVALVLGLALGVGFVFLRDYFENTIKDPDEVERYLHLDLLAAVPRYEKDNNHLVTEAYQTLRTALIFGRRHESGQVVLVTGTAPSEGKTTTLVNIAKLLAAGGEKTVVLDCDLRRASLHAKLGVNREPGLTDFFVKQREIKDLIQSTRFRNLYAITAGPLPPNPPAILARENVTDCLEDLRRQFQWILVDSPPIASVTDALLLARHVDIAVLVVQHNKVDKKIVKRSVAALKKVTPNVIGAVLNAVDIRNQNHYYYYYTANQSQSKERTVPGERKPRPGTVALT